MEEQKYKANAPLPFHTRKMSNFMNNGQKGFIFTTESFCHFVYMSVSPSIGQNTSLCKSLLDNAARYVLFGYYLGFTVKCFEFISVQFARIRYVSFKTRDI